MNGAYLMFDVFAESYDAIYKVLKDYAAEADAVSISCAK